MNYEIVELDEFSGKEAKIYSIIPEGETEDETLFDKFVKEYKDNYKVQVKDIIKNLYQIAQTTGARSSFFKLYEGNYGDFVCAMYDMPNSNLRLYCIRFGMVAVILGGGGVKPKEIKKWQHDSKLKKEAELMIEYAKDILNQLDTGELYWSRDKTELEGKLKNYGDDN